MTNEIQNQDSKELAKRIKDSLAETQHRFEISDPRYDTTYRLYTAKNATEKAEELGATRFQGRSADGQVMQISKVDGEWKRSDGKSLADIQDGIDKESVKAIEARAKHRVAAGHDVDAETDKQMAQVDARDYLRIQNPDWQDKASRQIAENVRANPNYKAFDAALAVSRIDEDRKGSEQQPAVENRKSQEKQGDIKIDVPENAPIHMQSMPGKIMSFNDQFGRRGAEIVDIEDGTRIVFGGKEAINLFGKVNKLSKEDTQALIELDSKKYTLPPKSTTQITENENALKVPMQSMPDAIMIYNDQPGKQGVEVWKNDGTHVAFGSKKAIDRFVKEHKLTQEDVQTLNELDSKKHNKPQEKNTVEPVNEKENFIDISDAVARAAQNRQRDNDHLAIEQNRRGTLVDGKRIDVENPSEKATKQDAANDNTERSSNTNDRQNQQDIESEKNRQFELMEQLHHQFRVSGAKFHFKDQPGQIAFKDKGEKLVTASNDERVAKAMATMSDAKGWKTIKVSGHPDFQREVWMEASLRGIEVRGFKPSEQDIKALDGRREHTMKNIVEQDATGRSRKTAAERQEQTDKTTDKPAPQVEVNKTTDKPAAKVEMNKSVEADSRAFTGRVLEHGQANYNHDPEEKQSYFVKLDTNDGEKTVWGVDLNRAMSDSKAGTGDEVKLEFKGKERVVVEALDRDEAGKVIGKKSIETNRNTWEVQISEKAKVVEAVAATLIESKVKDPANQQILKAAVGARLIEREQIGKVPTIPIYDKAAAIQTKQPEQISPQVQRTERTR